MKKLYILLLIFFGLSISIFSQQVIKIWDNESSPTQNGLDDKAELFVYLPKVNNQGHPSPVVLICPGGGYASVSMQYEGHAFAKWMASQGIVSVVLKYRLPNKHKEIPFDDAEKAMQIIKENATNWNVDLNKVGVAGFSAGGHLAAILSNKKMALPIDFSILFYPVISFENATKGGTRNNLLGENPLATDIITYSADLQVTDQSPTTIIFTADNDASVPPLHSTKYYEELKKYNIPAALYVFPVGGHGWAMLDSFEYNNQCLDLLKLWLRSLLFDSSTK